MHDDGSGDVLRSDSALDQALTGGQPQTVGRFRFLIDDERWEWSDEVQEIHGYAVGEMPNPTTEQVLSHKHPDDYAHVVGALEEHSPHTHSVQHPAPHDRQTRSPPSAPSLANTQRPGGSLRRGQEGGLEGTKVSARESRSVAP